MAQSFPYSFTPQILDLVLRATGSTHLVLKLWKVGNSSLRSTLERGITELQLALSFSSRVPRLIGNFPALRTFRLFMLHRPMLDPKVWRGYLDTLPETLEVLALSVPYWQNAFLNFVPQSVEAVETKYERGVSRWINLAARFPRLVELEIGQEALDQNRFLAALPPSLTCLKLPLVIPLHFDPDFLTYLPRGLIELHTTLNISIAREDDWLQAPPHLQLISTLRINCAGFRVSWLPKSLCGGNLHLSSSTQVPFDQLQDLPPHLSQLVHECPKVELPAISSQNWPSSFPKSLTKLDVKSHRRASPVLGANVMYLPHTLTDLSLPQPFNWRGFSEAHSSLQHGSLLWPSGLLTLHTRIPNATKRHFYLLPRTLTHLDLALGRDPFEAAPSDSDGDEDPSITHPADFEVLDDDEGARRSTASARCIYGNELPPNLHRLSVSVSDHGRVRIYGMLPQSLDQFHINTTDRSGSCMVHEDVDKFPPTLTKLVCVDCSLTNLMHAGPVPWTLPTSLAHLVLDNWKAAWIPALPKTLTKLSVYTLEGLYSMSHEDAAVIFKDLPPGLTELVIADASWSTQQEETRLFSPESFAGLEKLRKLDCELMGYAFPSKMLKNLPRRMEILRIALDKLDSEDVSFIPSYLEDICLTGSIDWSLPGLPIKYVLQPPYALRRAQATEAFIAAVDAARLDLYH